jgi:hypothetical protein
MSDVEHIAVSATVVGQQADEVVESAVMGRSPTKNIMTADKRGGQPWVR